MVVEFAVFCKQTLASPGAAITEKLFQGIQSWDRLAMTGIYSNIARAAVDTAWMSAWSAIVPVTWRVGIRATTYVVDEGWEQEAAQK